MQRPVRTSPDPMLTVPLADGRRRGLAFWDGRLCTYRAEIDLFDPVAGVEPPPSDTRPSRQTDRVHSIDELWEWLLDPRAGAAPHRVTLGDHLAEFITIDALLLRLEAFGFEPDEESRDALVALRDRVAAEWGSVVFLGRVHPAVGRCPDARLDRDLGIGLPDGRRLPISPRFDHPGHHFDWGRHGPATARTARAMIDLAWSTHSDPATDAAVTDLAVTVLAEISGGFAWRAESVADWIATETGDLTGRSEECHGLPPFKWRELGGYRQLSLELGPHS